MCSTNAQPYYWVQYAWGFIFTSTVYTVFSSFNPKLIKFLIWIWQFFNFLWIPVVRAKVLKESYNEVRKERRYRVRIIAVFKSKRKLENRDDIFVFNDYCNCPKLRMKEHYVIMGKEERNTGLEDLGSYSQLVIPPRPFVWKWRPRMTAGLRSIKDICGN